MLPILATDAASDAARATQTAAQQAAYFTTLTTLAAVSATLLVAAILAITLRSTVRAANGAESPPRAEGFFWAAALAGFPIVSLGASLTHILCHARAPEGLTPSDLDGRVWWTLLFVGISVLILTCAYTLADTDLSTSNPRLNPVQSTAKAAEAAQQAATAAAKAATAAAKAAQQCAAAVDTARPAAGGQRRPWGRS
ncbi:hypothetical protein, partial [Micrococcus sp. 116]|uniref:hypothetical protein n=1 Tax=Micrococcus sp. 116 TaxID=2653154 RepID=UPI001916AEF8